MSNAMINQVRLRRQLMSLTIAHIVTLDEVAFQLPQEAELGRMYPARVAGIANGLTCDRGAVSRTIDGLVVLGVVIRDGDRLGLAMSEGELFGLVPVYPFIADPAKPLVTEGWQMPRGPIKGAAMGAETSAAHAPRADPAGPGHEP